MQGLRSEAKIRRERHDEEINKTLLCLNFKIQLNSKNGVRHKNPLGVEKHQLVISSRKFVVYANNTLPLHNVVDSLCEHKRAVNNPASTKFPSFVVYTSILH